MIVDETDCCKLDCIKKTERTFGSTAPQIGAVIQSRWNLGYVCRN